MHAETLGDTSVSLIVVAYGVGSVVDRLGVGRYTDLLEHGFLKTLSPSLSVSLEVPLEAVPVVYSVKAFVKRGR